MISFILVTPVVTGLMKIFFEERQKVKKPTAHGFKGKPY
jgi:hypothetical protein